MIKYILYLPLNVRKYLLTIFTIETLLNPSSEDLESIKFFVEFYNDYLKHINSDNTY